MYSHTLSAEYSHILSFFTPFLKISFIICEFCVMYFDDVYFPSPNHSSHTYPTICPLLNILLLFFFNPWSPICAVQTLSCGASFWSIIYLWGPHLYGKLPLQGPIWCLLLVAPQLRVGLVSPPCCAHTGLGHAVTASVSSYLQLPCCVQKMLFPPGHPLPLALTLFPSPLPK